MNRTSQWKIKLPVQEVVHDKKRKDIFLLLAAGYSGLNDSPRTMPVWSAMNSR